MQKMCPIRSMLGMMVVLAGALAGCVGGAIEPATPTEAMTTYTVQAGDTLGGIAQSHGTTVDRLIALNEGQYPQLREERGRLVVVGWELTVPTANGSADEPGAPLAGAGAVNAPLPDSAVAAPTLAPDDSAQSAWQVLETGALAGARVDLSTAYLDDAAAAETIQLVNNERARLGIAALTEDAALTELARQRARALVWDYSHNGASTAEILASTYRDDSGASFFVNGWIASPGHYAILSAAKFAHVGAAVFRIPDFEYESAKGWSFAVQVFSR